MSTVKRPYRSPRRKEGARRTRDRVIDAAHRLWVEHGFAATTMHAIAAEASVSAQTIYAAFGSKGGVLTALLGRLEAQAGGETLMRDFADAPTPRAQLEVVAGFNRRLFEGGADLLGIALGSRAVDPEVAKWVSEGDRRRLEGQRNLVDAWQRASALAISAHEALDVLYTLTSPELFLILVERQGWEASRYERWVADTLATLLIGGTDEAPPRGRVRRPRTERASSRTPRRSSSPSPR